MIDNCFSDCSKVFSIQNNILNEANFDAPLENTLSSLTDALDSLNPEYAVAILRHTNEGLRPLAGNRISKNWAKLINPLPLGPNHGSCGTAGFLKQRVIVENILEDPLWADYREYQPIHGFMACWSQPIINNRNELLGTLAIYFKNSRKPKHQELEIMQALANSVRTLVERKNYEQQLNCAIEKAELRAHELNTSLKRLKKVEEIAHLGSWEWDMQNEMEWTDELYRIFGLEPQGLTPSYDAFIECIHPDDREKVKLAVTMSLSQKRPFSIEYRITCKDGTEKIVHEHGNVEFDSLGKPTHAHGIMHDITERKEYEKNLHNLTSKLESLSYQDSLTDIPNRRMFDITLNQEWKRSCREQQPLSLIMIDIDYFKQYNDHYGHQSGDDCLKTVALSIAKLVNRSSDLCARYGGEEFVLLLPNINLEQATQVAEKCRESIFRLNIPHAAQCPCSVITVSAGVFTITPDKESPPSLLVKNADKALYLAKNNGRNLVMPFC